ncbi:MAG: hypothetical protein U1F76_19810 [Candidatus Competibacteraceae bacterium]
MNLDQEVSAFERIVNGDDTSKKIILVHGESGMGKTYLLNVYKKICSEKNIEALDFGPKSREMHVHDCIKDIQHFWMYKIDFTHFDNFMMATPWEPWPPEKEKFWLDNLTRYFFMDLFKNFDYNRSIDPKLSLDASVCKKITDLVIPLMDSKGARTALLTLALGTDCPVLNQFNWDEPSGTFVPNMIKILVNYSEGAPGKQALWAVLKTVREKRGVDFQAVIDELEPVINGSGQDSDQDRYAVRPTLAIFLDEYETVNPFFGDWLVNIFLKYISENCPIIVVIAGKKQITPPQSCINYCQRFALKGVEERHYRKYAEDYRVQIDPGLITKVHDILGGKPAEFATYVSRLCTSVGT